MKYDGHRVDVAMEELSSEPKEVKLISVNSLQEKDFECEAKVSEDGKILVKIHLDLDMKFENYKEFSNYYYFSNDDE